MDTDNSTKALVQDNTSSRHFGPKAVDVKNLGDLEKLYGTWSNKPGLAGRGWNMIALPFISDKLNYRILMNQYNEKLKLEDLDGTVPNRGVLIPPRAKPLSANQNQQIVALDYQQVITQIAAKDFPVSGLVEQGGEIHHEPGMWLNMLDFETNGFNIARLGTIPHGNSVLALGSSTTTDGPPIIPDVDALPIGGPTRDLSHPYLSPYDHFSKNKFQNLFNVTTPAELLRKATPTGVKRTTTLHVSTEIETGGIVNIPFIVNHANATEMFSTFWIMELENEDGKPELVMQYMQVVMLEFFERVDGIPGLIKWPHVSFNTMKKTEENEENEEKKRKRRKPRKPGKP